MSTHCYQKSIEILVEMTKRQPNGADIRDYVPIEVDLIIEFSFQQGAPAIYYGDNAQPADPDDIEILNVWTKLGEEVRLGDGLTRSVVDAMFEHDNEELFQELAEAGRNFQQD